MHLFGGNTAPTPAPSLLGAALCGLFHSGSRLLQWALYPASQVDEMQNAREAFLSIAPPSRRESPRCYARARWEVRIHRLMCPKTHAFTLVINPTPTAGTYLASVPTANDSSRESGHEKTSQENSGSILRNTAAIFPRGHSILARRYYLARCHRCKLLLDNYFTAIDQVDTARQPLQAGNLRADKTTREAVDIDRGLERGHR